MALFFTLCVALSRALYFAAAALVAVVLCIVVWDVTSRNLGLTPPYWGVNTVEYALFWIAFLSLPDLVRTRGHVSVEVVLAALPEARRRVASAAISLAAAGVSAFMTYWSGRAFLLAWTSGSYEVRTFDMPEWIIYLPMPIAFLLAALMFLRLPLIGESYHTGPGEGGGL